MSFKFSYFPEDDLPSIAADEAHTEEEICAEGALVDDAFEDDLPADFAELGAQLRVDAARLGSVYPACRPPLELIDALAPLPRRSRWVRWLAVGSSAVAATAAAVLLTVSLWPVTQPSADLVAGQAVVETAPLITIPVVSPPAEFLPKSRIVSLPDLEPYRSTGWSGGSLPVSYRPAAGEVSGPQLEGLLDLWNEQSPAGTSIAF